MASLTEFRWPQSSADSVKYNAVAESLNKGLKEVWGE